MESNHNSGISVDLNSIPQGWNANSILQWMDASGVMFTSDEPIQNNNGTWTYILYKPALNVLIGDHKFSEQQPEEEGYNYLKMIKLINKDEKGETK